MRSLRVFPRGQRGVWRPPPIRSPFLCFRGALRTPEVEAVLPNGWGQNAGGSEQAEWLSPSPPGLLWAPCGLVVWNFPLPCCLHHVLSCSPFCPLKWEKGSLLLCPMSVSTAVPLGTRSVVSPGATAFAFLRGLRPHCFGCCVCSTRSEALDQRCPAVWPPWATLEEELSGAAREIHSH